MATVSAELADPKRPELRSRVQSGLVWKVASQGIGQIVSMLATVVLARLLSPQQFGIAGMALVVTAFVIAYSDCGLGLALVQKSSITEQDRSTVFWASVGVGATMTGICIAIAPIVAGFYHTKEVEYLLDVLSLSFLLTGLGSTHRSLHYRAMNFRVLEIRATVAAVVGEIVTVVVAVAGGGAWSFVVGGVIATALSTILLWTMGGWVPRLMFSLESLRGLGGFGFRYLGGSTFTTLNQNADNILVGRVLGGAALGTYTLAYSVILVPLTRLAYPVTQTLSPAFARLQHDKPALARSWIRSMQLLAMVFLPLILTVAVITPDIVHVVFGDKWNAAVPVMRVLALACAMLSIQGVCDSVLQGAGQMRVYVRMSAFSFALNLVAFVVGIQWGLVGMAVAFGISTLIFISIYVLVVARVITASIRALAASIVGVVLAAAVLLVVETAVYVLLLHTAVGPVARAAVTAAIGIGSFAGLCAWREAEAWSELMRFIHETVRGVRGNDRDATTAVSGPKAVNGDTEYVPFDTSASKRDVLAGVLAVRARLDGRHEQWLRPTATSVSDGSGPGGELAGRTTVPLAPSAPDEGGSAVCTREDSHEPLWWPGKPDVAAVRPSTNIEPDPA